MHTPLGTQWVPNGVCIGYPTPIKSAPGGRILQLYLGLSVIKPTVLFHGPAVVKVTVAVIVVIGGAEPTG